MSEVTLQSTVKEIPASTGIQEPWPIPNSWQWLETGGVATVVGGGTPKTSDPENFDKGEIPWITPADLSAYTGKYIARGARNITEQGLKGSSARLLPTNTVLFSSRAPIGYVAIASQPVATNQGFKSFVLPESIDPSFVYYYLKCAKEAIETLGGGTTFKEISGAVAAKIPLVLAPLAEQRRIVAEIETQLTRLDASVAALRRARANLKRYRASVLKDACEGRLVPTEAELARSEGREYEPAAVLLEWILAERRARWESQEKRRGKDKEPSAPDTSALPQLSEGWVWIALGQCFDVYVGATPRRNREDYWNGEIAWVSSGEVSFKRITETRETITTEGLKNSSTDLHPPGTVLLGMIGEGKTRGQVSILDIYACNSQNSAAIRVSEAGASPEFVYYYLWGQYRETRQIGSGNNQPALNKSRVQEIFLPLPPLAEQRRIVAEVERRLSAVQQAEATVEASLARAERLRQSILKQAFSGRLVPQDPDDEPASVLLERIRAEREAEAQAAASSKGKTGQRGRRMATV